MATSVSGKSSQPTWTVPTTIGLGIMDERKIEPPKNKSCACGYSNKFNDSTKCEYCGENILLDIVSEERLIRKTLTDYGISIDSLSMTEIVYGVTFINIKTRDDCVFSGLSMSFSFRMKSIGYAVLEAWEDELVLCKIDQIGRIP